jgi:hypothetical protein
VNEIQQNGHDHPGQQQKASFIASSFQRSEIISAVPGRYNNSQRDDDLPDRLRKPVTMLIPRKQRTIAIPLSALHISHPHRLAGRLNKYPNRKTNVVYTFPK